MMDDKERWDYLWEKLAKRAARVEAKCERQRKLLSDTVTSRALIITMRDALGQEAVDKVMAHLEAKIGEVQEGSQKSDEPVSIDMTQE